MNQKEFVNIAVIIGIIIVVGIIGYFVLNKQSLPPTPTPTITVSLGQEFTLKKGETARVKDLNVFLKVTDFIYSPCPKGAQCSWSGLDVVYEVTVDGEVYERSSASSYVAPDKLRYDISLKNSDYKTYATLVIDRAETHCIEEEKEGLWSDRCWNGLAGRFYDKTYCGKIQNSTVKDECIENLAEKLNSTELCRDTISPIRYCQYLRLVSQNSLAQCDSIIIFRWRVRCFKDIAEKTGQGINICNTLEPNKASVCREAISGPDY